jgi:hypothetical protein
MIMNRNSVKWIFLAGVMMLMISVGLDGSASTIPGKTPAIGEIVPSLLFVSGIMMIVLSGLMRWISVRK